MINVQKNLFLVILQLTCTKLFLCVHNEFFLSTLLPFYASACLGGKLFICVIATALNKMYCMQARIQDFSEGTGGVRFYKYDS